MGRSHQRYAVMEHLFRRFWRTMLKKSNLVSFLPFQASSQNLSLHDAKDNVSLSLENSVIKVLKKTKASTSITDIEQWTNAFTTYLSVFTDKFSLRSQELLQYLSLIRYAARVHKGWDGSYMTTSLGRRQAKTNYWYGPQLTANYGLPFSQYTQEY